MNIKQVYRTSDGEEFDNLPDAKAYEESLIASSANIVEKYLKSYEGERLLSKHSLKDCGIWKILGEDPNCDFGGYHHSPYLETVEGELAQVIRYAVKLKSFYTWGSGGKIVKVDVKKI